MKIYVVVSDPDFYRHYDSVWQTLDEAKSYIEESERLDKVVKNSHLYGPEYVSRGHWVMRDDILTWYYPGSGGTYGIIEDIFEKER